MTTVLLGILIGLAAGGVARKLVSEGGYGLGPDLLLGVAGSGVATLARWMFGAPADAGTVTAAVTAFVGAGGALCLQRDLWAAPAVARRVARLKSPR